MTLDDFLSEIACNVQALIDTLDQDGVIDAIEVEKRSSTLKAEREQRLSLQSEISDAMHTGDGEKIVDALFRASLELDPIWRDQLVRQIKRLD